MKHENSMKSFFVLDDFAAWQKEWQNMPEFIQEDLLPMQQIIINFATQEDVLAFSELIKQKLTPKTQSVWYPKVERENLLKYLYIDES